MGHLPHHTGEWKADSTRMKLKTLKLTHTVPCARQIAQTCLTHTATTSMGSKYVSSLKSHVSKLFTFYAFQTLQTMSCGLCLSNSAERRTTRIVPVTGVLVSCSPMTPKMPQ